MTLDELMGRFLRKQSEGGDGRGNIGAPKCLPGSPGEDGRRARPGAHKVGGAQERPRGEEGGRRGEGPFRGKGDSRVSSGSLLRLLGASGRVRV